MSTTTTTTPYGVIITETEDSISFRLPSWLTVEERARIRSALDTSSRRDEVTRHPSAAASSNTQWAANAVNSSGARQERRVQR